MSASAQSTVAPIQSGTLMTVDWGTTHFRAALLDGTGDVLDRIQAPRGILHLEKGEFPGALAGLLQPWFAYLPGAPVLMAGMIGSADGLVEVPYLECPASLDDIAESLVCIADLDRRPAYIVPGLRGRSIAGTHDVMRGEEIQILGAISTQAFAAQAPREKTLCLPGTHSKWVTLEGRQVVSFSTSMTGDAYAALRSHTLLKRFASHGEHDTTAFRQGLELTSQPGGLLHHLFSARTQVLLGGLACSSAAAYLSGILIGEEVRAMIEALKPHGSVSLIGNDLLTGLYAQALENNGVPYLCIDGDAAAIAGLHQIASHAAL